MLISEFSDAQIKSMVQATARQNIWEGSVRSGKTIASIQKWVHWVLDEAPSGDLLMTGKTLTTLKRNVLEPMGDITFQTYTTGKKEINMLGRRIYLEGANDERAEGKIRGMTLAGVYCDELTLMPESFHRMLLSRMSIPGARLFGTTNPDGPYHWLKQNVLGRQDELDLKRFHFTLSDNDFISDSFIENIKTEYTGLWYKRFIQGLWVKAEGAVYGMFDDSKHVVASTHIPWDDMLRYWVGVDYGTTNPTVFLLLGQAKNGVVYVIREYRWDSKAKGRQKSDQQYAEDFAGWIGRARYKYIWIDPSAASFGLALRNKGIRGVKKADNSVTDGIRNVSTLLSAGLLKINEDCEGLIKEISSYSWDPKAEQRGEDKPLKVDDHGPDALRYPVRMIYPSYCKPYLAAKAA